MTLESQITEIQMLYPRIYIACHADHVRAASSAVRLSPRDSSILAHLSVDGLGSPSKLSKHLGISMATFSEALSKLVELGYVRSQRNQDDERKQNLSLTEKGLDAMKKSSVLDSEKLRSVLKKLTPSERRSAIEGLSLLAHAGLR